MEVKTRPYLYYDATVSICSTCFCRVDAKIVFQSGCVWMLKRCPEHGPERVLIADDIGYYKRAREDYIKTPEQVQHCNTPVRYGCPYDCGICPDHEQHGCTLLIEVTDACNLRCPTCYAESGPERQKHRSLAHVERMLDAAVRNEGEPSIVQISGGEPTIHPQIFDILDAVRRRPIKHLMINTNGIRIANDPDFVHRLALYRPEFEVYLQFDSFHREALQVLRGTDLRSVRSRALAHLNQHNIPTTLVVTVRRGVNDDELGQIIDFAREQACVRGVTFQPVQAAGRLEGYEDGYDCKRDRLTLTEVRRRILQQSHVFEPEDIIPVPCHADSVAMAYALKIDDDLLPLTRMIDPEVLVNYGRNTIAYEHDQGIRSKFIELFSTHHSPRSQASAMSSFLDGAVAKTALRNITYENIFRVLIVEFSDAYNFDLRSIRKSCVHIVHPDAIRLIPFETYNMFYRDELEQTRLAEIRKRREATRLTGPLSTAKLLQERI